MAIDIGTDYDYLDEPIPPPQTFYSTYGTGVCLTIDGREVIVDLGTMGFAIPEACTVDGEPVQLTDEQCADAEGVFDHRLHADVPVVW